MKHFCFFVTTLFIALSYQAQVTMLTNLPPVVAPTSDLKVEVKINKGNIGNFSKYEMELPQGFEASEGNSKTGYFTFEKGRLKIVWVTIPSEVEFIVSFKIRSPQATGSYILYHKFLYMDNGVKKEVNGQQIDLKVDPTGVTRTLSYLPDEPEEPVKTNTVASLTNSYVPVVVTNSVQAIPTTTLPATTTSTIAASANTIAVATGNTLSTTQTGLTYLVQIGTFSADPGKAKYADLGKVTIEKDGVVYKVLIGEYVTKEEALKKREELIPKGYNGFLVKYQYGKRVK
ncbi:MAG: SPOR domain-containing protein [Bacteroidia bacterium]|nr:SPOR domain-containing protein [Bacteroidia bacterium]